jgi:phosphate:Na+ symporter
MVPERGEALTQHLDDSLYAVPPVALEAVQRTLERSAHALFLLYQNLLSRGYSSQIKAQTATLRAALERAYEFLSHVHLPADNWALAELRMAQLHVIDHQLRLCHRIERLERSPIDFSSGLYHWAVQSNQAMLNQALSDQASPGDSARLADIEKQAASLEDMAHQVRRQVLHQDHESGTAPAQALQTTDAFRWLARSGHHVWRICHYLKQAHDTTSNGNAAPVSIQRTS